MAQRKLKKIDPFQGQDHEGSWAVSYADMITLLCGFFVLFFSFDFAEENEVKLESSLLKNIALMTTAETLPKGVLDNPSQTIEDLNEISTVVKKEKDGNMVIFFKGVNFFNSGDTALNDYGKVILELFVDKFLPFAGKFKLKIQAFTDDEPVTRHVHRYKDNIELSALRSISVLRFLEKNGVPLRRAEIGGKGIMSEKALALMGLESDDKEEIRAMSRTIAFILHREDA